MNISENQKNQVIKRFRLLCDTFLPSKEVQKNIEIVFREQSIEREAFYQVHDQERKFFIYFWNQEYESLNFLCEVVSHEFTHVLFYLVWGEHTHQTNSFQAYAAMFYVWLWKKIKN